MDVIKCIEERRSIRLYKDEQIPDTTVDQLITLGTKAATGSNGQPWGFAVIQGREEIRKISDETISLILKNLESMPHMHPYESALKMPGFDVFNGASTVIAIYGDTSSHWYVYDCSLAASNMMLAAHSMGIGTCWIGYAQESMNTPEFKARYHIPEHYDLVCPMALGYITIQMPPPTRKDPVIFRK